MRDVAAMIFLLGKDDEITTKQNKAENIHQHKNILLLIRP